MAWRIPSTAKWTLKQQRPPIVKACALGHLRSVAAEVLRGYTVHAWVIKRLSEYGDRSDARFRKIRSVGIVLQQLKALRTRADYELDEDFSRDDAATATAQCGKLVEKVDAIWKMTDS